MTNHERTSKASDIAIILAAAVVSGAVLYQTFLPQGNSSSPGMPALTPELVGKHLALQARDSGAGARAILFVKPGCRYCSASMPFYQRLMGLKSATSTDLKIVAAVGKTGGNGKGLKDYLGRYGVVPDGIESVDFAALGVRAVPTLVLIDNTSRVAGVWTGLLPPEKAKAVLTTLKRVCDKCTG